MNEDVTITILTGGRPNYLRETLVSLQSNIKEIADANIVAMVNGADLPSLQILKDFPWIKKTLTTPRMLPIGQATSRLYKVAAESRLPFWMHLEDDWRCIATDWLAQAKEILANKQIGQVRLRKATERVLSKHMIKHTEIRWKDQGRARVADAHYTFNPSLVRTADVASLFPCNGEIDAMRKFVATKRLVAQSVPGAFVHIGHDSLRERTGTP